MLGTGAGAGALLTAAARSASSGVVRNPPSGVGNVEMLPVLLEAGLLMNERKRIVVVRLMDLRGRQKTHLASGWLGVATS